MIKTEEINLGVALFSVNTLRYYVTTNDIPAQLSPENMISSLLGGGGGGGVIARGGSWNPFPKYNCPQYFRPDSKLDTLF